MKCPACQGRRKVSQPCKVNHSSVHDCYEAGCLIPKACATCLGEGVVVTDAILANPAKLADFVAKNG